jgi:hypothetical protein
MRECEKMRQEERRARGGLYEKMRESEEKGMQENKKTREHRGKECEIMKA